MMMPHDRLTRRETILPAGAGFGALPLSWLLQSSLRSAESENSPVSSHRVKVPHRFGRAKSVIFLFMEGGRAIIDTFDPKPKLNELAGQKLPPSFKPVILSMGEVDAPLFPSKRKWARHGVCSLKGSVPHIDTVALFEQASAHGTQAPH